MYQAGLLLRQQEVVAKNNWEKEKRKLIPVRKGYSTEGLRKIKCWLLNHKVKTVALALYFEKAIYSFLSSLKWCLYYLLPL